VYIFYLFLSIAAAFELPTGLDVQDRKQITEIVGLGSSTKLLSDPYPLGGYSGVEVSLSLETLPTEQLGVLGNQNVNTPDNLTLSKISLGKGLFENIDLFLHFIPFSDGAGLGEFGGLVRWGFFETAFLPISFSFLVHGNSSNLANQVFTQSIGFELVTGIHVTGISLYFGAGRISASSQFKNFLSSSGTEETSNIANFHSFIGGSYSWEPLFLALQMDRYTQTVLSLKAGLKF
jgi:hypothetical protein